MDTTIGERFSQLIEAHKLTTNAFATSLGKPYTSIKVILDGVSKPGFELIEKILTTYPNLSSAWLLMGEGNMFRAIDNQPDKSDNYLREHLHTLEENFSRLASQLEKKDQQLEAAVETAKGLQRTIDALISRPSAPAANFPNGVAVGRFVVRMHPATQLLQVQAVA